MRSLILNGAEDASLETIEISFLRNLENRGYDVSALQMRDIQMDTCAGCFNCWVKSPGQCTISDAGRDVAKQMITSDVVVYLTPVTFGGYSYQLKKAVDRFLPNILPFFRFHEGEIHHPQRYTKRPILIGLGVLEKKDAEQERMFAELNYRNALNLEPPGYAAGVVYFSDSKEVISKKIVDTLDKAEVPSA
ncbi:flavodoxin family protein [candidate division WOR-3 bacterium]|nr:flavodoxin family protein [candidate division WOR-3 bacterium]